MNKENYLIEGAISPNKIASLISSQQTKTDIGAHDIFLGQVRSDIIEGKEVLAIEYSAYEEMANKVFDNIRESAFTKFELSSISILHSIGAVGAGELCLFVLASSKHRAMAFDACRYITEEIKAKIPVFGKEIFDDETYQWKVNK